MSSQEKEEQGKLEAILIAAQKKFGQFGLGKTTMNDIASELGMGKASIYYYFPTKEKLYEAVVIKEQEQFIQEIGKTIKPSASAVSLLKLYTKKRVAHFENCLNLSKLSSDALLTSVPCVKKLYDDFGKKEVELIRSIIELGIKNGEFQAVDAQDQADFLVTIMLGLRIAAKKKKENSILEEQDYVTLHKNMVRVMDMFIKYIQP
jgi:TetR/AcrR family transcriptional repressor of mexJK operon